MRFRLLLILSSLLLLSVNSRAEEDKYIFEHIQTSHHWINDIFQDSDGFIWVMSREGLVMYDPKTAVMHDPVATTDYFSVHDMPLYYRMEGLSQEWLPTDSHAGKAEEYCSE